MPKFTTFFYSATCLVEGEEEDDDENVQRRIKNDPKYKTHNPRGSQAGRPRGAGALMSMKFMNMIYDSFGDLSMWKTVMSLSSIF